MKLKEHRESPCTLYLVPPMEQTCKTIVQDHNEDTNTDALKTENNSFHQRVEARAAHECCFSAQVSLQRLDKEAAS